MGSSDASTIFAIFSIFGTISFLLLFAGMFKPSLVVRKSSLQTRKGVLLIWGLAWIAFTGAGLFVMGIMELPPDEVVQSRSYYVKGKSVNVRECPSTSCKVIDSLSQNTPLTFSGDLFDKNPDWAEITFPNGKVGYISKTTLSENTVPDSQLTPTDDSSSVGGIIIGPWSDIQTILGDSYEFHFCEPPSAISGATCGALSDTTTDPKGGTPPYSFVKKSGFLPPGMTLELNGTLRGSPTQTGTYNFRLCAKDLHGGEGCQNLAVAVKKTEEIIEKIIIDKQPNEKVQPFTEDNVVVSATLVSGKCGPSYRDESRAYEPKIRWNGWYWEADVSGPVGTYMKAHFTNDIDCGAWHRINEDAAECERNSYSQSPTTRVKVKSDGTVYPPGVESGIFARWGNSLDNEYYLDIIYSCQ